jgi:hypothetical protein
MTRRRRRLSTPLALLAGFALCLAIGNALTIAHGFAVLALTAGVGLGAGVTVRAAHAAIDRQAARRRAAAPRPARTGGVIAPYCPNRDCPNCYPSAAPAARPDPAPAAKPADRPLSDIDPTDPDAAEAVRRNLRRRAAGRSERIDPPATAPEGQP